MNKTFISLRWLSMPFVFVIVLLLATGLLNYITKIFNPNDTSDNIIMMVASGFGSFFAIKASFIIAPSKSDNVLYGICGFVVFFYGMAFWNSIIKEQYSDIWGYIGNIIGLIIAFYSIKLVLSQDN
ncbi:MAG TPA: hypothetical protein VFC65_13840 [Prolixibacteraceae bacterium]|nr:hypothetical protein [Prolixibacteraceae bacterium]